MNRPGTKVEMSLEERLVFHIGTHRIDLEGEGECDCEDFRFRVQKLRRTGFKHADCWHIRKARSWFGDFMAKKVATEANKQKTRRRESEVFQAASGVSTQAPVLRGVQQSSDGHSPRSRSGWEDAP